MTLPIRLVIAAVRLFMSTMKTVYNRVKAILNNIRNIFRALPGQIRSAVSTLVSIISKPFKDAYNKIKSTVESIKTKVRSIGNISLSSITNAITKPFKDAYDSVVKWVDKIKSKAKEAAQNIPIVGGMFGGTDLAYGGEDVTTYTTEEMKVSMTQDINLSLDLKNVPPSINEDQLYSMIDQTIQSRDFIKALTTNSDFQTMDKRAKQRINAKTRRARGA